jgi:hypothetical protein
MLQVVAETCSSIVSQIFVELVGNKLVCFMTTARKPIKINAYPLHKCLI